MICNVEECYLLNRYLEDIKSKAKIIVFCNKSKITEDLLEDKQMAFVSSYFGQIIKYLKKQQILMPVINDETKVKIV